ncbi:MAG: hypothetical protein FIO02_11890 [Nitrosopumilales archaeon]|jgi:hypothetical protein|nr:hypothetical protein [Nitrosopumilales archaeon]
MIQRTLISVSAMEAKAVPISVTMDKRKYCITCGTLATQKALFRVMDATLIERYCDKCVTENI